MKKNSGYKTKSRAGITVYGTVNANPMVIIARLYRINRVKEKSAGKLFKMFLNLSCLLFNFSSCCLLSDSKENIELCSPIALVLLAVSLMFLETALKILLSFLLSVV